MTTTTNDPTMIEMPADLDETLNHAAFKAGMPYICWGCAEEWMPNDNSHPCLREYAKDEEVLAAPYASRRTNLLYRLMQKNRSIDKTTIVEQLAVKHPLLGVAMSLLTKAAVEKREAWVNNIEGLDDRIKQRILNIKT